MARPLDATLYVVVPLFNPHRYESHYRNQRRAIEHVLRQPEVHLVTIEMAYAGRPHEISQSCEGRHTHIEVRGGSEIWAKENLINLAVQRLPSDWQYVAWVDGDVSFVRDDWALETLHALQHHAFIQPWSDCWDTGPDVEHLQHHKSFCRQYVEGKPHPLNAPYGGGEAFHPGYAWAATRTAWDTVGGLIDTAILGAADHHCALALLGLADRSLPEGIHPSYARNVLAWQERAATLYRNIGYVKGGILHHWHGRKARRFYQERWKILVEHQFDPDHDLRRNSFGVWELAPHRWELRDAIRRYFSSRLEDCNSVE